MNFLPHKEIKHLHTHTHHIECDVHRITRLPITPSPSPNTNALLLTRVMISSDIVSYSILIRVFFPFYIHIYMKINHIHTRLGDDKANMLYGRLPRTAERTKLEKCALVSISCCCFFGLNVDRQ